LEALFSTQGVHRYWMWWKESWNCILCLNRRTMWIWNAATHQQGGIFTERVPCLRHIQGTVLPVYLI
jgi:hypothetical protein